MPAPAHAKEIAYPASIFGRMNAEQGFGLQQRSADKLAPPIAHEIERLAVQGWGSKPDLADYTVDSIGHFRSREDSSRMHVLYVRPMPGYQPVRAVVTLPIDDYLRYACNPFAFARAGFFDFLDAFMADPDASGFCSPAAGPLGAEYAGPMNEPRWTDSTLAAVIGPLLEGRSTILRTPGVSAASTVVEEIAWAMPIALRSRVTLLSFAYADADMLKGFAPVLACVNDPDGAAPGPEGGYGPADADGLSAVLAARRERQAPPPVASDDRHIRLDERIVDLERRFDEFVAIVPASVAAKPIEPVEAPAKLPSNSVPPKLEGEDHDGRHRHGFQTWVPLIGGLTLIGAAGVAGFTVLSMSLEALHKQVGSDPSTSSIVVRLGAVEQGSGAISQRLSGLEESGSAISQGLAALQEHGGPIAQRLGELEAADVEAFTRLDALATADATTSARLDGVEEQWKTFVTGLGVDPDPATVAERLKELRTSVSELVAAVGLSTGTETTTLLAIVEQLADVAAATSAKAAEASNAFAAAQEAIVAPLRALPDAGTAMGNRVSMTWVSDPSSGLVTIEARRRSGDDDTRLRIAVDGEAGTAVEIDDRDNRLKLGAAEGASPLELTTLRVRVGSNPADTLSITVATLSQPDPAAGRLVRILGIVPQ